jgi:tetratricopeptide (TPR) repeat protein
MTDGALEEGKIAAIGGRTRWTRCAVLGAVLALVVGVYAWSAHSGLIELYGPNAESTYYNLLVQGFRAGQLNLKTEAPPGLGQLADPCDPMANKPYRWSYEHPLHDLSYYKGKLYLYFGITPALVLFWPYVALTGHYLLHKDAVVIFFSAGFLAGAGLLLSLWRRYFAGVSFWIIVPCVMALGLANLTSAILERCDVYEVAISCGYAMTMLALAGLWGAWHDARRRWRWLAAASLAYGLAVGARPSLLLGAIILLAPVVQAWRENRPVRPLLMAATIPIVLIGLGLMFYNALRFGNPLDFGQHYQLSAIRQDTMKHFSLRYLWFNLRVGFLEPARWSGHSPFVNDIVAPSLPTGAGEIEHPFGVLTNIPLIWLALAVPLAWRNRSTEARSTLRWFPGAVALLFGICALTIGLYFTMCLRYEVEFAHLLVLLAVIGILGLERALAGQPAWRRAARCGWGLLLAFSVAFNLLASFDLQAEAHINRGNIFLQKGSVDKAITEYRDALQIRPDYSTHNNLGTALREKGRMDEAITQFQLAVQGRPDFAIAHCNLGIILCQENRVDEAIPHFQKALQILPNNASFHFNFAAALLQKGRVGEAITQFELALQIDPVDMETQNNLAWLLATWPEASVRNGDKAVQLARRANELSGGKHPVVLHTLAAAFAEAGRFSEAVETAQRALRLAGEQSDASLAGQIQSEIKLYQAGSPFHGSVQTH